MCLPPVEPLPPIWHQCAIGLEERFPPRLGAALSDVVCLDIDHQLLPTQHFCRGKGIEAGLLGNRVVVGPEGVVEREQARGGPLSAGPIVSKGVARSAGGFRSLLDDAMSCAARTRGVRRGREFVGASSLQDDRDSRARSVATHFSIPSGPVQRLVHSISISNDRVSRERSIACARETGTVTLAIQRALKHRCFATGSAP